MRKNDIVTIVLVDLAALLLPLFLGIPSIPLNLETLVSLGGGLAAFYLITGLTARKGWKKWIFLMPLTVLVVMAISYIPFTPSKSQLRWYYIVVVAAIIISICSHILGWLGIGIGIDARRPRFRLRRPRHEEDEDDEQRLHSSDQRTPAR